MKSGVTAAGVLMMIIGASLWFTLPEVFKQAGKSATEGSAIGLYMGAIIGGLGFLVFIAGLAASPPQESQPVVVQQSISPAAGQEALVICPGCGSHVPAKSKFCSECGEKLEPTRRVKKTEEKTETSPSAKPKKVGFCMYCGAELPEEAGFCPECGKKVKK